MANIIEQMNDMIERIHPVSLKGLKHLEEYFDMVHDPSITDRRRVDNLNAATLAQKTIGMEGRLMASRANTASVMIATASKMGLAQQALGPLWKSLTGASGEPTSEARELPETTARNRQHKKAE